MLVLCLRIENMMREDDILREQAMVFVANNAYVIFWGYIVIIWLITRNDKKMVKYKQKPAMGSFDRGEKAKGNRAKRETESEPDEENEIRELSEMVFDVLNRHGIYFVVISGVISIIAVVVHYLWGGMFFSIEVFPIIFGVIVFVVGTIGESIPKIAINISYLLAYLLVIAIAVYYWGGKLCFDAIIFTIAIFTIYGLFQTVKCQHRSLIFILGLNIFYISNKYNDIEVIQSNLTIIESIATSIIASAIILIFTDFDEKKKNKNAREYYLRDLQIAMITLLKKIYSYMYQDDVEKDFSCANYEEFKSDYVKICEQDKNKMEVFLDTFLISSLEKYLYEVNVIKRNEDRLIIENILAEDEVCYIDGIKVYVEDVVEKYRMGNKGESVEACYRLFDEIEEVGSEIPEIQRMIMMIGKQELTVHREIGTMLPVWSDGSKITAEDYYRYKKSK